MADEKKKKGPKTLLGVFDIIPDPDELDDLEEATLGKLMEEKVKPIVVAEEGMIETFRVEELAFGAKKIVARILLKEKEGGTTPLEDAISDLPEVQRAECGMVSIVS